MDLQQPNFEEIADEIHRFGDGIRLCANLPAIAGGNEILQALNNMAQQFLEMRQEMQALGRRVDAQFNSLTIEMRARDQNAAARMYNSVVVTLPDTPMEPLCSLRTGEEIPNFPRAIRDVNALNQQSMDIIFDHLLRPVPGQHVHITQKRQMVRVLCGLIRA
ncbi:uncharacterized protein DNG_02452 [Cephalotrichum gorgonifer]|uniref:Uncharacterized protein n=1 Tax=Cephalotrichum gorgonifer TaxID=2041049 RepID=A0AAE8MTI6_9PEZI|nr:uncharacterized protein DNG_02452 [Cephalotrichum gorgonifer]